MSFYGPSQYYYLYKELGKKYNPDLVIVGYHLLTDTWDSLEYDENKRYYLLKSIPDLIVPKSLGSFLKQNSFLYKLFLSAWYSYANKQDVMANNVAFNEIRNGSQYQNQLNSNSDIIKKAWISSENYLKLLEKEVHSSNSKIIFLSIPAKAQIYPDEWKDIKKRGLVADEKLYSDSQSRKKLNMLCGKNKWDCLDLQDGLRNATKDAQMFLEKDFHFTNEGNKTVASEIYKYLINKKIIKVN